jgi:hypothetical protein
MFRGEGVNSATYEALNNSWNSTTKILFGQEMDELTEYEPYLKGAAIGQTVVSSFSGKEIWVASEQYPKKAKFFDYGKEQDAISKSASQPFDINKIKDMDSIIETLQEKFVYSGNKAIGNSRNVEHSDAVVDSTDILNSSFIVRSKRVAYSYLMRENEDTFGSTSSGQSTHIVRCFYNNALRRCFECCTCIGSSDCYFSYNLTNCMDCLFTFNVRTKRYLIGNVQLGRDEYLRLKAKLIGEMAEQLKKEKQLDFSIVDFMEGW